MVNKILANAPPDSYAVDHRTIRKTLAGFRRGAGVVSMLRWFNAFVTAIRACMTRSRQWSRPIRKTVLAAPPPVHRRLAPFASEAADNGRLPLLRSVVNCLARQATEEDAQGSLFLHRSLHKRGGSARSLKKDHVNKAADIDREPSE